MATLTVKRAPAPRLSPLEQFIEAQRARGAKPPTVVRSDGRNDGYSYGDKAWNSGCDWRNW